MSLPTTPRDPILRAFDLGVERAPTATLAASPSKRASRGDVDALARAAGVAFERAVPRLRAGSRVAFAAANGPGFFAGFLAILRRGCAAILLDGSTPEAERPRIARGLGAAALLEVPCGWPSDLEGGPGGFQVRALDLEASILDDMRAGLAVIKVTSGSTGSPRGVVTPTEALVADDAALAASMGLCADDVFLATVPMTHSYGLSSLALPALVRGSVVVTPDGDDPLAPLAAAHALGATVFPTVPAYLDALLRLGHPPTWPETLRLAITAGAPLPPATARRFRETFGRAVHVFYGASESGGICYDREGGAGERGTVGTPVDGVTVDLDSDSDEADSGVVSVASAAVARGYVPEADARLGGGRYRTGDLATWRSGPNGPELALLGRVDDLVNIKGKKVHPREVERVLAEIPGVLDVVVYGVARPLAGGEVLRAVIACREGSLSAESISAFCRTQLAAHKIPRSLIFVRALPRTERGKLDRATLERLAHGESERARAAAREA